MVNDCCCQAIKESGKTSNGQRVGLREWVENKITGCYFKERPFLYKEKEPIVKTGVESEPQETVVQEVNALRNKED